jgi:phage FluMu gp28-like protein
MLNQDIPQTLLSRLAFRRQMLLQAAARRDHLVAELKVILPKTAAVPLSMHFTEAQCILSYQIHFTKEILYRLLRLESVKRACIDASGMGIQLGDELRRDFGWKVEPLVFTPALKEMLASALRADFEERNLRIVHDDKLRADLRALKKLITTSGNSRFDGSCDDSHCDRFWALALRQHAARYQPSIGALVG